MGGVLTFESESHSYAVDGRKILFSVSEVLELGGIKEPYPASAAFYVARAAELGTTVHEWARYLDEGGNDVSLLEGCPALPYVLAYQRFREECEPQWDYIEHPLADEELGCAGTPDRIGVLGRTRAILDIKTPRQTQKYWGVQLSAYEHLSRSIGFKPSDLLVLWLREDGTYKLILYESCIPAFLGAVEVAKWKTRR